MAENNNNLSEKDVKQANEVFETLLKALDEIKWKYRTFPDDLAVSFDVSGEDIPMSFVMNVDATRKVVRIRSWLPFKIDKDHRIEVAIATCQANFRLADGCFQYNLETGEILFSLTSSYRDSIISTALLTYMVHMACTVVDEYNDKFMMMGKGYLSLEDFLKQD